MEGATGVGIRTTGEEEKEIFGVRIRGTPERRGKFGHRSSHPKNSRRLLERFCFGNHSPEIRYGQVGTLIGQDDSFEQRLCLINLQTFTHSLDPARPFWEYPIDLYTPLRPLRHPATITTSPLHQIAI